MYFGKKNNRQNYSKINNKNKSSQIGILNLTLGKGTQRDLKC